MSHDNKYLPADWRSLDLHKPIAANNTLVYVAISRKLIDGVPANNISTVPVMPWEVR